MSAGHGRWLEPKAKRLRVSDSQRASREPTPGSAGRKICETDHQTPSPALVACALPPDWAEAYPERSSQPPVAPHESPTPASRTGGSQTRPYPTPRRDRRERPMHPTALALLQEFEPELSGFPASLPREFAKALDGLAPSLSPEDLRAWSEIGIAVAKQSLRSWETAAEYFRVAGEILVGTPGRPALLPFPAFRRWAETGRELAEESSALATAYFRAGPHGLERLSVQQMREWATLGKQLYKGTW